MKEYIERDEAVRKAIDACIKVVGHGISHLDAIDIAEAIDDIPAADVAEVQHGYWYEHHGITLCSRCQSMFDTDLTMLQVPSTWEMPNYCPNCGAKMDGGKNNVQMV